MEYKNTSGGVGSSTGDVQRDRPWILSCESWMSQGAYVILPINPEQLNFDLAIRTSNDQARAAQAIYVWRDYDRGGTSFVLPTITLTVNSGYIVPSFDPAAIAEARAMSLYKGQFMQTMDGEVPKGFVVDFQQDYASTLASGGYLARIPDQSMTRDYISTGLYKQVGLELEPNPLLTDMALVQSKKSNMPGLYTEAVKNIPIGIQNLYAMFSLIDERRIRKTSEKKISKHIDGSQTENRAMLVVSTPAFPRLVCYGWFGEDGLKFSESADEPGCFNMDFSFIVTQTEPLLGYNQWNELANVYAAEASSATTTLEIAQHQWPNGTKAETPRTTRAPAHTKRGTAGTNTSQSTQAQSVTDAVDAENAIADAANQIAAENAAREAWDAGTGNFSLG